MYRELSYIPLTTSAHFGQTTEEVFSFATLQQTGRMSYPGLHCKGYGPEANGSEWLVRYSLHNSK